MVAARFPLLTKRVMLGAGGFVNAKHRKFTYFSRWESGVNYYDLFLAE